MKYIQSAIVCLVLFGALASVSSAEAWRASDYARYNFRTFGKRPDARSKINFRRIDYPLLHAAIFYETNRQRVRYRRQPFLHHRALEAAAKEHSDDMVKHGFFSHSSPLPGKRTVEQRVRRHNPTGLTLYGGENINVTFGIAYKAGTSMGIDAAGRLTYPRGGVIPNRTYLQLARAALAGWMKSPGHRRNILDANSTHLGTGGAFYYNRRMPEFKLTQAFGKGPRTAGAAGRRVAATPATRRPTRPSVSPPPRPRTRRPRRPLRTLRTLRPLRTRPGTLKRDPRFARLPRFKTVPYRGHRRASRASTVTRSCSRATSSRRGSINGRSYSQTITRIGCGCSNLPKSRGGGPSIGVSFASRSRKNLQLYWVGFRGKNKFYNLIRPGKTVGYGSYSRHVWKITGPGGFCSYYVIQASRGRQVHLSVP